MHLTITIPARFYILLLLFWLIPGQETCAQLFSNGKAGNGLDGNQRVISDTTKKKQINTDDNIAISVYLFSDTSKARPDTSIQYLHRSPIVPIWYADLGNTGSSGTSLKFAPLMEPQITLGLAAIMPMVYQWDHATFYNTTRPYTDVYYRIGSKTEQIVSMLHTQNVTPGWNIAAEYRKINSPGFYKWQKTNHDNFKLTTHYISPDLRYDLKAGFFYNKLQQDENGGILSEDYLFATNYNDKRLVPVHFENISANRSSVTNYFRDVSLNLQQQYYFGKRDSVYNLDSTQLNYRFQPIFSIKHQLYTSWDLYRYKDVKPDSNSYLVLQSIEFLVNDSLYTKYYHSRIGNAFSLNGNIRVREKVLQAEAGYGVEIDRIRNVNLDEYYYNNYLFANLLKPRQEEKEWLYQARLKFFFTGNVIGNFNFHAEAGRSMGSQAGTLLTGITQSLQSAPYMYTWYATNYFTLQKTFARQSITRLFLQYLNPHYHTGLHFNYYMLGNYFYRDTNLQSQQNSGILPLIQLQADKAFHVGAFVFDNQVLLQWVSANAPVKVPFFASRHRIAYEAFIIKKKLQIATGFDVRYNTPYFANDYAPLYFDFVTQTDRSIGNVPEVAYFFNFKIKRFRASVAFDQLQQLLTRNNVQHPGYAAQNFGLRFGLSWVFVN